jgi:hypothetical protein
MRFSLVVPVGAWSPFLPAALRSLALQGVDIEIALCDASGDPRVPAAADASGLAFAYRRHGPDKGQSDAIAEGWANTRGEILGWLNADDVLLPNALDDAADAFARDPRLDVWFGHTTYFDLDGSTIGRHDAVAPAGELLLRSCTISQPSCLARRSAVDAVGGVDRAKHFTMDWDLWSRLYRGGARFGDSPKVYSAVLVNSGSKTSSLSLRRLREIFAVVEAGAGRYAAAKSVVGVTIHHLANYSVIGPLLGGRSRSNLTGASVLPVLNLGDAPQTRLAVHLGGPGAGATELQLGAARAHGPLAELPLPVSIAPGHAAPLQIRPGGAPVWLERAGWIGG